MILHAPQAPAKPRDDPPPDGAALVAMEERLRAEERYDVLYEVLLGIAAGSPDPRQGALTALRAAGVAGDRLADPDRRHAACVLATRLDPAFRDAFAALCELDRTRGDYAGLAGHLEHLAGLVPDPFVRAAHLAGAGDVWSRDVGDSERALTTWVAALRAIPPAAAGSEPAGRVIAAGFRQKAIEGALRAEFQAAEAAGRALELAESNLRLGRLLAPNLERRGEAVEHLLRAAALADGPGRVALEILGGLHALKEGWSDLVQRLEAEARAREPTDPEAAVRALRRMARACLAEPPVLSRAEAALRRLLALDPEDNGAAESLVSVLTAQRRHREAAQLLSDLGKVAAPSTAALYLVRAGVLHLARFADRAASLACFEAALQRHHGARAAATHLKEAYREAGRWSDLARVMLREVEGNPFDEHVLEVWKEAARILAEEAGDLVAAAEVYRRVLAEAAGDPAATAFFEAFHERLDVNAEIMQARERDAARAGTHEARIAALIEAGQAALRLGSPRRARGFLEAARAEAPEDTDLLERQVALMCAWGEHRGAAEALERMLSHVPEGDPRWPSLALRLAEVRTDLLGEASTGRALLERVAAGTGTEAARAGRRLVALARGLDEAARYAGEPPSAARLGTPDAPESSEPLGAARDALARGEFDRAVGLADAVAAAAEPGSRLAGEAQEFAADIIVDYLGDADEGLDRWAALGRDRRLPVDVRRRVNEARVRILERDMGAGTARDAALIDALGDAAAVADRPEQARALVYRRAMLLAEHPQRWRAAVDLLEGLLGDEPDNRALLGGLARLHEREEQWGPLADILEREAELTRPEEAPAAYLRVAVIAGEDLGDGARAARMLRRALERAPGRRELLEALAHVSRRSGDHPSEVEALRGWMAVEQDHAVLPGLHFTLAEALEAADRPAEAADHYLQALEGQPEGAGALMGLERTATQIQDPEERVRILGLCTQHARDVHEAATLHDARGRVLLHELGDVDGARAAAEAALSLDPECLDALELMREIAEKTGATPLELAELLRREVWLARSAKEAADGYAELGALYAGPLSDPELAQDYFEKGLAADPQHPRSLSGLVRLSLDAGDPDRARPHLEALGAAESAPTEVRAWALALLGEADEADGDGERALAGFCAAVALDPESPRALLGIGRLSMERGENQSALEAYGRVAELGETGMSGAPHGAELAEVYARMGALHRRLSNQPEAIRAYRRALARDAVHREALLALSALFEAQGEWNAAAEVRERAALLMLDATERANALATLGAFVRDRVDDGRRALDIFRQAASLSPDVLAHHASVLALARRLGRSSEAREAALHGARLAPDDASAADYLAAAAESAEIEDDREGALELVRAALERDPLCQAALARAVPLLEAQGRRHEAAALLERAGSVETDDRRRLQHALDRARLLQDAGDELAAAGAVAQAAAVAPEDRALLLSLLDGPLPPAADARVALPVVAAAARRKPHDASGLTAVEVLASGAGDLDRAYVAASLLGLVRLAPPPTQERLAALHGSLPERPGGRLAPALRDALSPPEALSGAAFYAEAEALDLAQAPPRRALGWADASTCAVDPDLGEEAAALVGALAVPASELRIGPAGTGVRVDPDTGAVLIAEDLVVGRLAGERRFVLAFGLALGARGHRWVTAAGPTEATMQSLLDWLRGGLDPEVAMDLAQRYGAGARDRLGPLVDDQVPAAADYLDAVVAAAARLGLVAAGDLVQGVAAAVRILAPGTPLPRSMEALEALGASSPTLADLLDLVHSDLFFEARRALGTGVSD